MEKKAIHLLQQQIEKLSKPDFDLEAWKEYSIIILNRIFGKDDVKIMQIRKLEFEYNSWSLRDASGNSSYQEGTKKLAMEIMQAGIDEIQTFGLSMGTAPVSDHVLNDILNCLLDEMKGAQVKKLKSILASSENNAEKKRQLKELIEDMGPNNAYQVLVNMLMHPAMANILGL